MDRLSTIIGRATAYASATAIWFIAFVVVYDVIARLLGHPTLWALEVSMYLMVGASILAAGDTLSKDGHFQVKIFIDLMPQKFRNKVELFVDVICALLVGAFAYGGFVLVRQSITYDFKSPTLLKVPLVLPQSVFLIGILVLLLSYMRRVMRKIRSDREKK